jgi:hypothetical protein
MPVTFTIPETASYWCLGFVPVGVIGEKVTISNIQLEFGSNATEYEKPHFDTLTADENGNVEGIIGNGEDITLLAESGVTLSVKYNIFSESNRLLTVKYKKDQPITITRCNRFIDDLEAIKQSILLILSTERYKFNIYSWDYGVELLDLYGEPMSYVMASLPRRIKEALIQDDRITDVIDFEFDKHGTRLHTTFTVVTNIGNISTELEVNI